jgi:DNA adenine methylase
MKPFFKWSGGKSKELKKIKKYLPENYNKYYEPFIGGGALWLDHKPNEAFINDSYSAVTNFYSILKEEPNRLIVHLNNISDSYNLKDKTTKDKAAAAGREFYYSYRDNEYTTDFDKAVQFYILRQLSFSGMLRFNRSGKFNVPFGWYKKMKRLNYDIEELLQLLDNTTVTNLDWKSALKPSKKNDFVFLDPPYTRVFQKYHPDGSFGQKEHVELSDWFKSKKAKAMIVINKDDFTSALYDGFIREEYPLGYSIRFRDRLSTEDATTKHFIATNY